MRPDWQQVRQLLVVSLLEQEHQSALIQILPLIQQNLTEASISVLAAFPDVLSGQSLSALSLLSLPFPFSELTDRADALIHILKDRSFDAAIVFTSPQQSPYLVGYCCYLSGIPIRIGQSCEFGGGILSHCIKPPIDSVDVLEYQLHLLRSVNLLNDSTIHSSLPDSVLMQSADAAIA